MKANLFVFLVPFYQIKSVIVPLSFFIKKVVAEQKKKQYFLVDFTVDIDFAVAIRSNVLSNGYERAFLLE